MTTLIVHHPRPLYTLCGFVLWDHSSVLTSQGLDVLYKSGPFPFVSMCVPKERITEIQACPTQHKFTSQGLV